jgi:hypothetical protein
MHLREIQRRQLTVSNMYRRHQHQARPTACANMSLGGALRGSSKTDICSHFTHERSAASLERHMCTKRRTNLKVTNNIGPDRA